ncbi:MAG TPA: V-type ATP synthase subunit F [Lachnospiraceae bacterium]|nr:V-type ATP synthase subunit F [Lachnospiraceae bacterium]HEX3077916.1 V-type ATP synthase subunit F [Lachnospiraceae bacterium]
MYKIAVVGDRESILIFKAFGADIFAVNEEETLENQKLMNRLASDGYAVILITEQTAMNLRDVLEHFSRDILPAIMIIPSVEGSQGLAEEIMRKNVEKAVGVDIL